MTDADSGTEADSRGDAAAETDRTLECDVAVVGAGPAGCVLSYLLGRSGVDTVLFERHGDLSREFRGYLFQPRVLRLFDEMGLLEEILELPHERVRSPTVVAFGRPYEVFDFGRSPPPYDYGLLMEQPPLLELLVDRATDFDSVRYRDATPAVDLRRESAAEKAGSREPTDDPVTGAIARDRRADERVRIDSRLVVGADGRYSTVRSAAGIDPGLLESSIELVWFKLPATAVEGVGAAAQGRIERDGVVLYFGLGGGEAQAGWFLERGTYPAVRERGIDRFRERIARVDPSLASDLEKHLADFEECSLLRIEPGLCERWVDDGLLLLGDAAHVASPIGAQGNSLAIADAAVAHATIVSALERSGDGAATNANGGATPPEPIPARDLSRFESTRRPAVREVVRLQRRAERALSVLVRYGDRVPEPLVVGAGRAAFSLFPRTPFARRTFETFAWGPEPVRVETSRFE